MFHIQKIKSAIKQTRPRINLITVIPVLSDLPLNLL